MIYSCTLFYNEFDLLEVKLKEEKRGGVDRRVVVEATRTHQNQEKPLHLLDYRCKASISPEGRDPNWSGPDYGDIFKDLITDSMEVGPEFDAITHENPRIAALQREAVQRNAAMECMRYLQDDDVVICADVDEIFPAEDIPTIVDAARQYGFVHLIQRNLHYQINLCSPTYWYCPFAVTGKILNSGVTLNRLRTKQSFKIHTNGKHFSFIMTPEQIADKFRAYSHVEFNNPEFLDPEKIRQCIKDHKDICQRERMKYLFPVEIDDSYPKSMLDEKGILDKWRPFLAEPTHRLEDIPMQEIPLFPQPDVEVAFYEEVNNLPDWRAWYEE